MLCFRGELTLGVHKIPFLEFSPSRTRQFNLDPITVPFRDDLPRESQALPIRESQWLNKHYLLATPSRKQRPGLTPG